MCSFWCSLPNRGAIRGHQGPSGAIKGNQRHSEVIREQSGRHQGPSGRHQGPSGAIRGPSGAIRGHQEPARVQQASGHRINVP
eukprot:2654268-Prymnesium_polylepis.1